ncbi:MAG TPA: fibrobacter succinogenes major paralogous domain-containing protein [Bacteroidales bacterium]|nr:fibrobacter succinogenes major paralogous domain-containing protein [Bacteroidales bacterium]
MKNLKHLLILAGLTLASTVLFTTCTKDKDTEATDQEVSFAVKLSTSKSSSLLKSVSARTLNDVKKIILTIQNADGTPTSYNQADVKIFQMNGEFFSQRITLKTGNYKVTQFMLADSAGNTIYATPLSGSQEAQFVAYPLPLEFEVMKDMSTPVYLDVINTENKRPADFGFVGFPIFERKGIYFNMSVMDIESGDLLPAKLSIYDNSTFGFYNEYKLNGTTNNLVIIDTSSSLCNLPCLIISKEGYLPTKQIISHKDLQQYKETPLLVELKKVTYESGSVKDFDKNEYKTVKIGNQWWMAENLASTHFADGTEIPVIDRYDLFGWDELPLNAVALTDKGYYTWGAAMHLNNANTTKKAKVQGVCPTGWHLPSEAEWKQLVSYLSANGYGYEGDASAIGKAIAIDSREWSESNEQGHVGCLSTMNNITGFSGIPLGQRGTSGNWEDFYFAAHWWTSTETSDHNSPNAWGRQLSFNDKKLKSTLVEKNNGHNVRCVKD